MRSVGLPQIAQRAAHRARVSQGERGWRFAEFERHRAGAVGEVHVGVVDRHRHRRRHGIDGEGSGAAAIASRNMPVIGDAESINAEMVYVSVPIELWLVLANNSPGDSTENVVPLSDDSLWIETGVCGLDKVGDAAVV
jgi:hypothetical protein